MNKLLITLAMLVLTISIANAHECEHPVSPGIFKQKFNHILAMRIDQHRLRDAIHFVSENCLYSRQVRQIANLFHDDKSKLAFAKAAYRTTYDKENFYDVYDAFSHFSNVFRLHDFVIANREVNPEASIEIQTPGPVKISSPTSSSSHYFPSYDYPSIVNYNEETYCENPIGSRSFNQLIGRIIRERSDIDRIKIALRFAQLNCLTVAQTMKIASMIDSQQNRFVFIKKMFDKVYDVMNYGYAEQLFTGVIYKEKFSRLLSGEGSSTSTHNTQPPPALPCGTSPAQFEELKQHIAGQTFNSTRITVAKQVIRAKECFTAQQIAELVLLFAFEEGRLEIAKFAYDYCDDKSNYYLVNNSFTYESTIKKLNQYIATRQ